MENGENWYMSSGEQRHSYDEILGRLDERTGALVAAIEEIKLQLRNTYVTQDEFEPIKRIAYGLVGTVLLSVFVALITVVVKHG
jgi:hypothetical protein